MANQYQYNPKIFDTNSLEEAKSIILTKEGDLDTEARWDKETDFLLDSMGEFFSPNENTTILDYGCGIGRLSKALIEKYNCKVVGVDISESMRKKAIEYVNSNNFRVVSPASLRELFLNGFRVDAALSVWVIQHCIEPFVDVSLIKNLLKKDAKLFIVNNIVSAVPTDKGWMNNGVNVHSLLKRQFEEIKADVIPLDVTNEKISKNTFISYLKNSKGYVNIMVNEQEKDLYVKALDFYNKKEFENAKETYEEILKINPNSVEAHANIGVIYKALGDVPTAIKHYVEAIKLNPGHKLTYNNLGNAFKEVKNYKMAIRAFSDCIKLDPKNFNAYNNLGIAYENAGDTNRAILAYKVAVRINPKYAKAINNIGVVLYKQKKYEESAKIFEIALEVDPNYVEVYSNMGASYNKAKDYDKAKETLEKAIELMPEHAGAYTNLGNVYNKTYEYKKAAKFHEKSIELDPTGYNAYSNVGTAYKYLGYSKKAIDSYKKAIELSPNFENAHFDLSTIYLAKEDFKNGWAEYEWRFKKEEMISHMVRNKDVFSKPRFTGEEDIEGKTLLLHSEQGFGDSIQFIRFLPLIKEKYNCKIAVKCRDGLKELFESMEEIDVLVDRSEETPEFDYQLAIMSMPFVLGMESIKDLPEAMPYLSAKDEGEEFEVKKEKGKVNIGICWSASATGESYDGKVFDLEFLRPIIENSKTNVYSLQVGDGSEDIEKLGLEDKVIDYTDKLTDFSKTAALINKMDLVISSDTAVAHLCGALNAPVWIPLQKVPDWRWTNKGETTKWYPSAKLFRQKTNRVWDGVFQSINAKLSKQFKLKIK